MKNRTQDTPSLRFFYQLLKEKLKIKQMMCKTDGWLGLVLPA